MTHIKRTLSLFLAITFILTSIIVIPTTASSGNTVDIYVSVNGGGNGLSEASPTNLANMKTVVNNNKTGKNVVVHLADGEYNITEPLTFGPSDSAYNTGSANGQYSIRYVGGNNTVISGGKHIGKDSGKTWTNNGNNLYSISLSGIADDVCGLYVGSKRFRVCASDAISMNWNVAECKYEIPSLIVNTAINSDPNLSRSAIKLRTQPHNYWSHRWVIAGVTSNRITLNNDSTEFFKHGNYWRHLFGYGDSSNHEQYWALTQTGNDGVPMNIGGTVQYVIPGVAEDCYIENAKCYLDKDGEYYFDYSTKTLWLCSEQNPNTTDVILPVSKSLLQVGDAYYQPSGYTNALVYGLSFENIYFKYCTSTDYNRVLLFEELFSFIRTYRGREAASYTREVPDNAIPYTPAISINAATHITFKNNEVSDCFTAGLNVCRRAYCIDIQNNKFKNLSGAGTVIGNVLQCYTTNYPSNYSTTLSVNTSWLSVNQMPIDIDFTNNKITCCSLEYGATGYIQILDSRNVHISYNRLEHSSYSGMIVGYAGDNDEAAWTDHKAGLVEIDHNYIYDSMNQHSDGAPIYTCGYFNDDGKEAKHMGCYIHDNVMDTSHEHINSESWRFQFGLYLDNGSQNVYAENNLIINCYNWLHLLDWYHGRGTDDNGNSYPDGDSRITRHISSQKNCTVINNYTDTGNYGEATYNILPKSEGGYITGTGYPMHGAIFAEGYNNKIQDTHLYVDYNKTDTDDNAAANAIFTGAGTKSDVRVGPVSTNTAPEIGGVEISEFTIEYPASVYYASYSTELMKNTAYSVGDWNMGQLIAQKLRNLIESRYSVTLPICEGNSGSEHKIRIVSNASVGGDYSITCDGSALSVFGDSYGAAWHAIDHFEAYLEEAETVELEGLDISGTYDFYKIACIGDGITAGNGTAYSSYPEILQRLLWKDCIVTAYTENGAGITDFTQSGAFASLKNSISGYDLAFVMLGSENRTAWSNTDAEKTAFLSAGENLFAQLKAKKSGLKFILANAPLSFDNAESLAQIRPVQKQLYENLKADGYNIEL